MRGWSIPAGRIFGVELRIHFTFAVLLAFVWITQSVQSGVSGALRGLALVGIIFGSVILHEFGHALVALRNSVPVRSIILLPIGGITIMDDEAHRNPNPRRDMRIAVAGPVVNLVLAVFFGTGIMLFFRQVHLFQEPFVSPADLPRALVWGNFFLGAFNLLPAYPLDGGRVLRAWFSQRMDHVHATRRAVAIGQTFSMLMIFGGIWNPWLMIIGLFLFFGAQLEDRSAVFHSVMEHVRMEDVMLTDFATLSPADTLEDALRKAVHSLQDDFPVVRGTDLVGVISRQHILETLRTGGNGYVQGSMNRIFLVAHRHDTLATVMNHLGHGGFSLVPVVDGDHLIGIVTLQNLSHSMALLAETRKLQAE